MRSNGYKTGQRQALLDFLSENKERHYTVDELALALLNKGTPVARSTLYRQLSSLLLDGTVRRFEAENESSFVYQYADLHDSCDSHFHLKCLKCGRLIHIECQRLLEAKEHIEMEHDFRIGSHRAVLYGECTDCIGTFEG